MAETAPTMIRAERGEWSVIFCDRDGEEAEFPVIGWVANTDGTFTALMAAGDVVTTVRQWAVWHDSSVEYVQHPIGN